jgi:RNA polymerase sigma factor for flagellar operon FliA
MSKREATILKHMPLVTFVVNRMSTDRTNTLGLDRDDAIGFGTEGLIQSVDGFDESRGTAFASFAIRRIRGSILDAVRRQDPLPRSLRRSTRQVDQASQELASQIGRWPTLKEIAMRLGITAKDVLEIRKHAASRFVSLENVLQDNAGEGGGGRWDPADNDDRSDPAIAAERQAALHQLNEAIALLSDRDQSILKLRYSESKPFHEVGRILGLSESRVCQLHKRILATLRRNLEAAFEDKAA